MTDIALTVTQSLPDFVERFVRAFGLATINWGRMEQLLELLLRIADDPTYNTSEAGTLPNHLVSAQSRKIRTNLRKPPVIRRRASYCQACLRGSHNRKQESRPANPLRRAEFWRRAASNGAGSNHQGKRPGVSNFQIPKLPPTGGSHLSHAHPSSFEMCRTAPVPTRGARDGRQSNLARSRGTCRVKARCSGRCAGCSCGRDSAARLGCRARRWQVYSRTHAAACEDAMGKAS